jgi:hypothetical protein
MLETKNVPIPIATTKKCAYPQKKLQGWQRAYPTRSLPEKCAAMESPRIIQKTYPSSHHHVLTWSVSIVRFTTAATSLKMDVLHHRKIIIFIINNTFFISILVTITSHILIIAVQIMIMIIIIIITMIMIMIMMIIIIVIIITTIIIIIVITMIMIMIMIMMLIIIITIIIIIILSSKTPLRMYS